MNKKGVELSMNVIIIAAIGLLVLVILAVLVINSTSKFQNTPCNTVGGICKATCAAGEELISTGKCPTTGATRCCKVFNVENNP